MIDYEKLKKVHELFDEAFKYICVHEPDEFVRCIFEDKIWTAQFRHHLPTFGNNIYKCKKCGEFYK